MRRAHVRTCSPPSRYPAISPLAVLIRDQIAVVGSGVFGLATALQLTRAGACVTLYDPAPLGDSASGVAAGMLAPGLESTLDPLMPAWFGLLERGRDLWPDLLGAEGAHLLDRSGTLFLASSGEIAEVSARLSGFGAATAAMSRRAAEELVPGLRADTDALFVPGDWRLSAAEVLAVLSRAFVELGGRRRMERVRARAGRLELEGGGAFHAARVVIATGAEAKDLVSLAPELGVLEPIKGQILHFRGGPRGGPVVRTPRGYVAPQPGGAVAGATMEPGRADRTTDPAALQRLRATAGQLFACLAEAPALGLAGVRASTPDGLPLVGPTAGAPEIILAVGARRNGWLLAPLVARQVVRLIMGGETGPEGQAFSPARFSPGNTPVQN